TCQINHAINPHHARVTAPKTRRAAKTNKRANQAAPCDGGRSSLRSVQANVRWFFAAVATSREGHRLPSFHPGLEEKLATAHYYSSGCSSCFIIYSTAPSRPPRKRPNKWPSS